MLSYDKKRWIIQQKGKGRLLDQEIASAQKISRMTVHRLWVKYQECGLDALKEQPRGRRVDAIPIAHQQEILRWRKKQYGIHKIRAMLQQDRIIISKEKIGKVLQWHQLHVPAPKMGLFHRSVTGGVNR